MKKIANFRAGDRAETLGAVLMQLFCAVTTVTRPEDCGVFDGIATLLRRERGLLIPEDSFLVQYKSRTETVIEYRDEKFQALLGQELSFFIASVDMTKAEIRLFSVGVPLSHPHIHDNKALVLHLDQSEQKDEDGVLHISLGPPILSWTAAELTSEGFENHAFAILKQWIELDRLNRRSRKMGIQSQIRWNTNELPSRGHVTLMWSPDRAKVALSELLPAIQMIGGIALSENELAAPLLQIITWLRNQGVEADPNSTLTLMMVTNAGREKLRQLLESNRDAEVAVHFFGIEGTADSFSFWEQAVAFNGPASAQSYKTTIDDVAQLGFIAEMDVDRQKITRIGIGETWLQQRGFEVVRHVENAWLLRKSRTK